MPAQFAGLVKHLKKSRVHLVHARAAAAFAGELGGGEVTKGKGHTKTLLP